MATDYGYNVVRINNVIGIAETEYARVKKYEGPELTNFIRAINRVWNTPAATAKFQTNFIPKLNTMISTIDRELVKGLNKYYDGAAMILRKDEAESYLREQIHFYNTSDIDVSMFKQGDGDYTAVAEEIENVVKGTLFNQIRYNLIDAMATMESAFKDSGFKDPDTQTAVANMITNVKNVVKETIDEILNDLEQDTEAHMSSVKSTRQQVGSNMNY